MARSIKILAPMSAAAVEMLTLRAQQLLTTLHREFNGRRLNLLGSTRVTAGAHR